MRDRKKTEEEIIKALDRIITTRGYRDIGVNAVAKEAGISKVLIYRYFSDFDGLLSAWALKNNYWTGHLSPPENEGEPYKEGIFILQEQVTKLFSDPVLREVERWLLTEKTKAGTEVMKQLEEKGTELSRRLLKQVKLRESLDGEALIAVLTAGITYLSLKSDMADTYNGISLHSKNGLNRIMDTVKRIIMTSIEAK